MTLTMLGIAFGLLVGIPVGALLRERRERGVWGEIPTPLGPRLRRLR